MGLPEDKLKSLFEGTPSIAAEESPLGGVYGVDPNSPYFGPKTQELEVSAGRAKRTIQETKSLVTAFGKANRLPKPKEAEENIFEEIMRIIDYPGRKVREAMGIPEGTFGPMMQRWMGLSGKETVEVPLPFTPPQAATPPLTAHEMFGFKPQAVEPAKVTTPAQFQSVSGDDPLLVQRMIAAGAAGIGLDIVTDPLTWLGAGAYVKGGGRAMLAFMPKGPFTAPGEAMVLWRGAALQEKMAQGMSALGKTELGRILGKGFIPQFGLPQEYHMLEEGMKAEILHNTMKVNKSVKQMFEGLNPDEIKYVSFAREFPELLDRADLGPVLKGANPVTADFIRGQINPGNISLDRVKKAHTAFSEMLDRYAEKLVDAGILKEDTIRALYAPHMLEPDVPLGFKGTKMPTLRGFSGKLGEEKPFFAKHRTAATLVDDINKGYMPILESEILARQFARAAEVTLAKKKFIGNILDEFGTQVIKRDMTDFQTLLEQGYKIYMPKGNLKFYPQFVISKAKAEEARFYAELTIDDVRKGIGVSKDAPAYLVPGGIADDLNRIEKVFGNNETMRGFLKYYDKVLTFWKGNVTVTSPGFHIRNEMGNIFNAWLGGLNNPKYYDDAFQVLHGGTVKIGKWGAEELKDMATQLRVYKPEGAFMGEITRVRPELEGPAKLKQLVNPISPRFAPVELGRDVGSAMENNARLALFLNRLDMGDSPVKAAQWVKKYLFDYGELTPFESQVMRRIIPFYTWMRKNVPLQLEHVVTSPGKYSMVQDILGANPEEQNRLLPAEQRPFYEKDKPLSVATRFRLGGLPVLASPDLPISDLGMEFFNPREGESLIGSIQGLSPAIASAEQLYRFFAKREAKVPMPEIYSLIFKNLPNDIRSQIGVGDVEGFITGKPVPGMNPQAKRFLTNALPVFSKISRLLPTEENLANPSYISGITSVGFGTRITPVDVRAERAKSILNYKRRLEDELKIMFREGEIDASKYNFAKRFIRGIR